MNKYVQNIIENIDNKDAAERSIRDLRLLIERYTMNRYSEEEEYDYSLLFSDSQLLKVRLDQNDIDEIKVELFFLILKYSEFAVLFAKCIKVLFDVNLWEPIRRCIYAFMKDDDTVCELIFAITNPGDKWMYDKSNYELFLTIIENGGDQSRRIALERLPRFRTETW